MFFTYVYPVLSYVEHFRDMILRQDEVLMRISFYHVTVNNYNAKYFVYLT